MFSLKFHYGIFISIFFILFSCREASDDAAFDQVFERAHTLLNQDKKAEAIRYVDSAFHNKKVAPYTLYRKYFFKKMLYFYWRKFDQNTIYVDSMLYVLEHYNIAKDHPADYAVALNAKADEYYQANDLSKAFEYYYKSRIAAELGRDTCALGNHTYHLGMVTYRQKNFEDAIKYFAVSFEQNKRCSADSIAFYRSQELYSNIGLCYTLLKRYDSAILYYNKALDFIAANRVKYGAVVNDYSEIASAVISGNMAKIHLLEGRYDTAKRLLLESIRVNEQPGHDVRDAVYAKLDLAELYGKIKDYPRMAEALGRIKKNIDTIPDIRGGKIDLEWRFNSYKYYVFTGQEAAALVMVDSFQRLRDAIDLANKKLNQTNISQLLESQEAQYQNEILKKNQQVSQLYLAITIGLTIMAIIIGVLIYANYRRSRRNIRELTELNKQVNEQKMQLQQIVNEKDTILHIVAHDLRDPIGGISYLSKSVLEKETDERLRKQLSVIHHTSQSSLTLINELMELSDSMRRSSAWERDMCDMNEIAGQVATTLEFKANEKGQKLVVIPAPVQVPVYTNKEKTVRALCNIMSNAIKFSNRDEPIYITVTTYEKYVTVAVKDTGIGIPEKMQAFVFNQFSSAKRQGTGGEKSYGLGLSISKKMIEGDGGELWFESEENKGTTFYIKFPVVQEQYG